MLSRITTGLRTTDPSGIDGGGYSFPYVARWAGVELLLHKVHNGDCEAFDAHQLRGEISPDDGSRVKSETTSYKGTHYVECYAVKNNVVVGRNRQTVIVT